MKRTLVVAVTLLLFTSLVCAEELRQPTQNPDAPYRLFNTTNVFTLLKLDTSSGRIWQVQWGMDKEHQFAEPINLNALVQGGKPGRFTLYPTSNIWTFILLDQETGDAWHVQWGKPQERLVVHID
jgi:hypothetical protein